MFSFLRKKKDPIVEPTKQIEAEQLNEIPETVSTEPTEPSVATLPVETKPAEVSAEKPVTDTEPKKSGFFARLKAQLTKTRQAFSDGLSNLILGKKEIDQDLLDELEMLLLTADIGVDATDRIIQNLTGQVSRKELKDPKALVDSLKVQLRELLIPVSQPLVIDPNHKPYVILMVGVNGVGKTTTIGKLAKKFQQQGQSVMLAAGDTFRAAAVEQLQTWGERNNVPVIAQKTGADSAAVIYDAIQSAQARNADILIADTAGRLHTQNNLMEELKKVKRVMAKIDPTAPHEILLVLDAGTGQNALAQAKQFHEAMGLTGLVLTKLDGTAKGGIIFSLAQQLAIPVRYIGVGETIDDLREFNANEFTEALFSQKQDH
jgi:fused signal recognition particle receptor